MQVAAYWHPEGENVVCELCPHACKINPGAVGRCGIRRNQAGTLMAEAYAWISSLALDPIEKKPLFHVLPGQEILSLGSAGCNLRCLFCQNWTISQKRPALSRLLPEEVIRTAMAEKACGVAYTYNEPVINFEYVRDCARLVKQQGLINVMVTNGYLNPDPLQELLPLIDAWNIDVKAMRPEFYQRFCGAQLQPVLETVQTVARSAHVELTYLVVTEGNDQEEEINEFIQWVASLSPEIPVHFSRYFPQYQWEAPATDPDLLERVYRQARRRLAWVYLGNVGTMDASTLCPDCGEKLISRQGYYYVGGIHLQAGHCPRCQRSVPGIFKLQCGRR